MKKIDINPSAMGGLDLFNLSFEGISFTIDNINPSSPRLNVWLEKEDLEKIVAFGNAQLYDHDRGK